MSKLRRYLVLALVLISGVGALYLYTSSRLAKIHEEHQAYFRQFEKLPYGFFGDPHRQVRAALKRDDYRFILLGGFISTIPGTKLSGHVTKHYGWRTLAGKSPGCDGLFDWFESEQAEKFAKVYNGALTAEILRVFDTTNVTEVNRYFAELKAPGNLQ